MDGPSLPPSGTAVRLLRGPLSVTGRIAWQARDQAGISFDTPIEVESWVRRVGHAAQQRVDEAVEAVKSRARSPEITDDPAVLDLERLSLELEEICIRLANSSVLTVDLAEDVLRLDALARALRHYAAQPNY